MTTYLIVPMFALIIAFISAGKSYKNYSINIPFILRTIYLVIATSILYNCYHNNFTWHMSFLTGRGIVSTTFLFIGCGASLGAITELIVATKTLKPIKKILRTRAMKFNKARVYTVLNADALIIESKVILGETLAELKTKLGASQELSVQTLTSIHSEKTARRFVGNRDTSGYSLAYLIEPPSLSKYTRTPFPGVNIPENIWVSNIFVILVSVCFILVAFAIKDYRL